MIGVNPALRSLATYPAEALYERKREVIAAGRTLYDFSVGDPIEATWPDIVEAFKNAVPAVSQYPPLTGDRPFKEACAAWVSRRFGVDLDPELEILATSGSKEAIFHTALTFIDPQIKKRRVLFGSPGYPVYGRGARFAGATPWEVELRADSGYRLEPWNLDAQRIADTAIIWINYPHNPTAACVDLDYYRRIAGFCAEHGILLCSDECYVDLYDDGTASPPTLLEATTRGVLVFHSLSKRSGMTGYRSGFVTGDAALIAILRRARSNFGVAQVSAALCAATVAWQDQTHVAERRRIFTAKRKLFTDFFAERALSYAPSAGTLYLWARAPNGDVHAYARRLAEVGIIVAPADLFGASEPYFRIALVPALEACRGAISLWRTIT